MAVLRLRVTRRALVRAPVAGNASVAIVVTVLDPLPNVPCHVVKPKSVRRLQAHGMGLATVAKKTFYFFAAGVGIKPGVINSGSVVIAPVELRQPEAVPPGGPAFLICAVLWTRG